MEYVYIYTHIHAYILAACEDVSGKAINREGHSWNIVKKVSAENATLDQKLDALMCEMAALKVFVCMYVFICVRMCVWIMVKNVSA